MDMKLSHTALLIKVIMLISDHFYMDLLRSDWGCSLDSEFIRDLVELATTLRS